MEFMTICEVRGLYCTRSGLHSNLKMFYWGQDRGRAVKFFLTKLPRPRRYGSCWPSQTVPAELGASNPKCLGVLELSLELKGLTPSTEKQPHTTIPAPPNFTLHNAVRQVRFPWQPASVIHHSGEHTSAARGSSGGALYTTAPDTLHGASWWRLGCSRSPWKPTREALCAAELIWRPTRLTLTWQPLRKLRCHFTWLNHHGNRWCGQVEAPCFHSLFYL